MEFESLRFVPSAGDVGVLQIVTYYFLVVAFLAFVANTIFALGSKSEVAPEHRASRLWTACIAAVAGISYFVIQDNFQHFLGTYAKEIANGADAARQNDLIRDAYNTIGQYRYMDWTITTPLLLLKIVSMLKIKPHQAPWAIALLLTADVFMVLTGYIGQAQYTSGEDIMLGGKFFWGTISTIGYIIIPIVLYRLYRKFAHQGEHEERLAFRLMALTTVTFWGVYPLGYMATYLFPDMNFNWIHIAFTIADIINKVGVGAIAYMAAKKVLERRVPEDAVMGAHIVG